MNTDYFGEELFFVEAVIDAVDGVTVESVDGGLGQIGADEGKEEPAGGLCLEIALDCARFKAQR